MGGPSTDDTVCRRDGSKVCLNDSGRTDFSRDVPQIKIEDFLITMDKEIKKAGTAYELSDTITVLRNNSEQSSN